MVKHVVFFKFKEGSLDCGDTAKEILLSMKGKVPSVKDINVGLDFLHSPRSFDLILEVVLSDKKDLDEYQNDPYHVDVVKKYIQEVCEKSIIIDYFF